MNRYWSMGIAAAFALLMGVAHAAPSKSVTEPLTQFYAQRNGVSLRTIIYRPEGWRPRDQRPAVVIFNGLGWTQGQPEWSERYARHYAANGLVAICAQYRLAQGKTTPAESIDDARDVIRWVRANAAALGVDPQRIVAHGLSTGGHLALQAAMFTGNTPVSPVPNALVLYSPFVDVADNQTLRRLLGEQRSAASLSPMASIRGGLPPTIILQGDVDTVTPFAKAKQFCDKMVEAGNRCELNRYLYVGHLFTPKGTPDDGTPKPDPRVEDAALVKVDAFLRSLGYIR